MNTTHPTTTTGAPALPEDPPATGWLLYDGECGFCTRSARRVEGLIGRRGFAILPLQTPWVREKLGLHPAEPLREMIVLTRAGQRAGGADAALLLAGRFWWSVPLTWLACIPGVTPLLRRGYAAIAARRSCAGGACTLPSHRPSARATDWLPLIVLLTLAGVAARGWEPWVYMWTLAGALFAGCKWLTWRRGPHASMSRTLGYLFAWPGLDAPAFLRDDAPVDQPRATEWVFAVTKFLAGGLLVWGGVRLVSPDWPLLAGWLGMIGLIFVLHFGSFHLVSLAWRRAGVNAEPLMHAPILAGSLTDFWGRRWNTAFRTLAHRFVFRRAAPALGAIGATVMVFVISGLVHDLVISIPARGGYGWPTAYFVIQAAGLLFERSAAGQRLGLGRGWIGRAFTIVVTVAPAGLVFHPPFVHAVILPMWRALGAT